MESNGLVVPGFGDVKAGFFETVRNSGHVRGTPRDDDVIRIGEA